MGWGDSIIATGLARGAAARGKKIAFGNGSGIIWTQQDHVIFRGNPNIAAPGGNWRKDQIEWIRYYRGNRLYGNASGGRWIFNPEFKCPEGEVYLTDEELKFGRSRSHAVILEPHVKKHGACDGANKQWPVERYQAVADELQACGWSCAQLVAPLMAPLLTRVEPITTATFRHALSVLSYAELYIGPEGGLHHGSAAVGTQAVVLFGGFNSPQATGYDWHCNISVGQPCGTIGKCDHCKEVMASIPVEQVVLAALEQLKTEKAKAC